MPVQLPFPIRSRRLLPLLGFATLLASSSHAPAQYVGKVAEKGQPVLRAIAVYQYTGALLKPNASRLVPVAVWDGERYQPGSLYLARPEPLAVAPGTQYVLQQSGMPQGLFDVGSAAQLNGSWVGLGRARPEPASAPPAKLHATRQLPVVTGGTGKGKAGEASSQDAPAKADSGPTLHRKSEAPGTPSTADSNGDSTGNGTGNGTGDSTGNGNGPTLHRRDAGGSAGGSANDTGSSPAPDPPTLHRKAEDTSSSTPAPGAAPAPDQPTLHRKDTDTASGSPAPDGDRPTLHRKDSGSDADAPALDPDRPTLHRHADASSGPAPAPDPDRPHLRYGAVADTARAHPVLLSDSPSGQISGPGSGQISGPGSGLGSGPARPGSQPGGSSIQPVPVAATVAVSDTRPDEPRSFRSSWPSPSAEADVRQSMHSLALKALAGAVQGSFGPAAAAGDTAIRHAAATPGSFGPAARRAASPTRKSAAPSGPDPLEDVELSAWELSPGSGTTYVYSAHTAMGSGPNPIGRYVTVIAQADFAGKPQPVFSQTTRSDTLAQTPALHLLDAVDTRGEHRAELLFNEQTSAGSPPGASRAFAIYSLASGKAEPVFTTDLGLPE